MFTGQIPADEWAGVTESGRWRRWQYARQNCTPKHRWAKSGVFERIFKLLSSDPDNEYMMIDATIVRAHQHSAGARKKKRPASHRQNARRIDHQNPCARRRFGQSGQPDADARAGP